MKKNVIRFIVDANGNYLESPSGKVRANNNTVDMVQFIAPFPIDDSVGISYLFKGLDPFTQYVIPTSYKGADVLESTHALYQDVADYNVWEVEIKETALAKISKWRNSELLMSLHVTELQPNSKCLSFEGYFG